MRYLLWWNFFIKNCLVYQKRTFQFNSECQSSQTFRWEAPVNTNNCNEFHIVVFIIKMFFFNFSLNAVECNSNEQHNLECFFKSSLTKLSFWHSLSLIISKCLRLPRSTCVPRAWLILLLWKDICLFSVLGLWGASASFRSSVSFVLFNLLMRECFPGIMPLNQSDCLSITHTVFILTNVSFYFRLNSRTISVSLGKRQNCSCGVIGT